MFSHFESLLGYPQFTSVRGSPSVISPQGYLMTTPSWERSREAQCWWGWGSAGNRQTEVSLPSYSINFVLQSQPRKVYSHFFFHFSP